MSTTATVAVRTRNHPAMLTRALASITSQTLNDYGVVIVSGAGGGAEVRPIVKEQKNAVCSEIMVVVNEISKGHEAMLESSLSALHSHYYAVHDDDGS